MKRLLEWIKEAEQIALLPHLRADGDALGSCYALAELIKQLKKTPYVILEEEPLMRFDYLEGDFLVFDGKIKEYDLVIAVDCSDLTRLGKREILYRGKTACIDHHLTCEPIGQLSYVDSDAAATAELVYQLACEANVMTRKMGTCIYTALSTDSGSFRYSNTTPRTMRIGAALMEMGIDTALINRKLYEQVTMGSLRFQAECVDKMQLFVQNKIAITYLTMNRADELELTSDDTDGGGSIMLSILGVNVGAFFHEREPGKFKVSLRSDEAVDVAFIAKSFGGGGHLRASGYTTAGPLATAISQLVEKIKEQLVEL
ncbi:MAG: bifunctional oligoribonuclease/PAP phosphatase NrnA [Ruminococcaceae bacterium]|nr:bifunctional oligoribonuclease/PAP phosphatase NrnA [Oscillospiraceae bacterium]